MHKTVNPSTIRLDGRKILITGVSRPMGIGATLARRFAEAGAVVAVHGFSDYDLSVGNALTSMENGTEILVEQYRDAGLDVIALTSSDLSKHGTAEAVVREAIGKLGTLDGLVLNHCYGTAVPLGQWTEEDIDPHLTVNIRASMMMIQAFAAQADTTRDNAITLFTSGQHLSPMINEIAYCVAKEAIICISRQSAYALGDKGIRVNCVNPGANDTGYCFGEVHKAVADKHPSGRWGTPEDTAELLLFLHSGHAKWITGQLIASDGGFKYGW
ncbi:MAG: SDR family oxidoreductase [Defluviitaleaceae bacterium]|nr:SDR family oxidoreductase [Defluviitaleaceae bacterium]